MSKESTTNKLFTSIAEVASDEVFDAAYRWLCERRKKMSHNADIWDLRWRWPSEKGEIQTALAAGNYRFSSMRWFVSEEGDIIELYSTRDALVQKAISIVLTRILLPRLSPACHHLKGHGGVPGALRKVKTMLPAAKFVCRSDVRGYFGHIDHDRLETMLEEYGLDERLMNLLRQYLRRTVCRGENYRDIRRGIPLRSPLSPLMGALYLLPLDQAMAKHQIEYIRYMDDWIILASSRGRLKRSVAVMNRVLASLGLEQHPDKTFIGRVEKGFDFLGVSFHRQGCQVSPAALTRFTVRGSRLYERGASSQRIGGYVRCWLKWYSMIAEKALGCEPTAFLRNSGYLQRTGTTLPFFSSYSWMLETAAPDPLP